jgi:hypothetical protein
MRPPLKRRGPRAGPRRKRRRPGLEQTPQRRWITASACHVRGVAQKPQQTVGRVTSRPLPPLPSRARHAMAASSLLRSLTRRGFAGPGAFNQFRHQHRSPFCTGAWDEARKWLEGFGPTAKGQKARVVVLGTRWAGLRLIKDLDTGTGGYDVVCVAPRGDMFTLKHAFRWFRFRPLEFRLVVARCTGVDPDAHTVRSLDIG